MIQVRMMSLRLWDKSQQAAVQSDATFPRTPITVTSWSPWESVSGVKDLLDNATLDAPGQSLIKSFNIFYPVIYCTF